MTETWLGFCEPVPGPSFKQGYPSAASRTLAQIEGEVKHSMEGPYTAALGELMKITRQASWHFSVRKNGPPVQHYPLESITWHCGVAGDRSMDTSLIGNLTLVGIEHEDWPNNALSQKQIDDTIAITNAIRELCPAVGAAPPTLRRNLWEHGWLSLTSCPSGLIPWAQVIEGVDEMTVDDMKNLLRDKTAFPELGGKSVIDQLKASPEYTLDSIGEALKLASDNLRSHGQ